MCRNRCRATGRKYPRAGELYEERKPTLICGSYALRVSEAVKETQSTDPTRGSHPLTSSFLDPLQDLLGKRCCCLYIGCWYLEYTSELTHLLLLVLIPSVLSRIAKCKSLSTRVNFNSMNKYNRRYAAKLCLALLQLFGCRPLIFCFKLIICRFNILRRCTHEYSVSDSTVCTCGNG